jgi:hypothetical protein
MSDDIRERVFQFGLRCIQEAAKPRTSWLDHFVPVFSWAKREGFILEEYGQVAGERASVTLAPELEALAKEIQP